MKISLIGDIAFNGILCSQPELNPERFKQVIPFLKNTSLVFANLETPVKSGNLLNEFKKHLHYTEYETAIQLLRLLNIGCVSLANNHIYDCKMDGLISTINLLDDLGIYHTGAGWEQKHIDPIIIDKDGLKIGFLAYVDKSTNPKTENFPELFINYFNPEKVKNDVLKLQNKVEKIICSIHWGIDYSYYPTPQQVKIARELIDAGVDIIMGHHPHTFQPYEKFKDGYIFYSLGGLTFGDYIKEEKTELQALFRKTKKSAIVSYNNRKNTISFTAVKEIKENYIKPDKRNYKKWSSVLWFHYKIKHLCNLTQWIYDFNEIVLYRVYEYFFGFYKNPVKRLLQLSNIFKIKILFKEFRNS